MIMGISVEEVLCYSAAYMLFESAVRVAHAGAEVEAVPAPRCCCQM